MKLAQSHILYAATEGVSGSVQSHNPEAAIADVDDDAPADDGVEVVFPFRVLLTSLDTPADLVTDFIPGFAGVIDRWFMVTEVVATSGGTADADIDVQIGATPVTGAKKEGLTQADFAAIGQVKQGGTITAANVIAADSVVSIVCTESAVNFTAGVITIYLVFKKAAAASKINAILAALRNNKQILS
jgi:hypothetical protein